MKFFSYIHASLLAAVVLLGGCEDSPKPPTSEAIQALNAARQAGAVEVAPALFGQAETYFQRAQDQLQMQANQFGLLRDYSEAKDLLDQTVTTATQAKTKGMAFQFQQLGKEREHEKEEVIHAITAARVALKEVKTLLEKAPDGKDAELILEIMESDVYSAEETLAEIPVEVTAQDYAMVKEKAVEVEAVTTRVREQILQAIRKVEGQNP